MGGDEKVRVESLRRFGWDDDDDILIVDGRGNVVQGHLPAGLPGRNNGKEVSEKVKTIRQEVRFGATVRLLEDGSGYAGVVIRDSKLKQLIDGIDSEEVWSRLLRHAASGSAEYFGFDGARSRFLRIFRDGFVDPEYLAAERKYKVDAKVMLDAQVPVEVAVESQGHGEAILAVFRATNLLPSFEKVKLQEVLRGANADRFIQGAARFAIGDASAGLMEMAAALKPHGVAKWTAITYLPFLWNPENHMFLKPEVTKDFAARVGHAFVDDYSPDLNPSVYESLVDLAKTTELELAELSPADRIDLQSFIWVVGNYEEPEAVPDMRNP